MACAKSVPESAAARNLFFLDAICPLVSKVHKEAVLHHRRGREIVLVGHAGHPEVEGTMGQLPPGAVTLVETLADALRLRSRATRENLAWITQTTLSVDDTAEIVAVLQERFPAIVGPHKEDICYATTNRQEAVKKVAPLVERHDRGRRAEFLQLAAAVRGRRARRLPEGGADPARRPTSTGRISRRSRRIGVTAGASAPEVLVEEVIDAFAARYDVTVELVHTAEENVVFNLPKSLREAAA